MNKKQKNAQEVAYLRKINEERKRINKELNSTLHEIVKKGDSLVDYELWINKKCEIMIQPEYVIERVSKDLEKEGFSHDIVYVIMKKTPEEEKKENETNKL